MKRLSRGLTTSIPAGLPEHQRDGWRCFLDLDLDRTGGRLPTLLADLRHVAGALATAEAGLGISGQRGDERVYLFDDEGALSRSGCDQAKGGEQLDGVPDRVPRSRVCTLRGGLELSGGPQAAGGD